MKIKVINSDRIVIRDLQSALDLMMNAKYENDYEGIIINKDAITEDFFRLSSGLAGEILQKFVNYNMKLAVYGDYSMYDSKPLRDFMLESNKGKSFFFVESQDEAMRRYNDDITEKLQADS